MLQYTHTHVRIRAAYAMFYYYQTVNAEIKPYQSTTYQLIKQYGVCLERKESKLKRLSIDHTPYNT